MTPRDALKEFDDLHVSTFGVRAVIHGGKDAKLLQGLIRSHGELVSELMAAFFATRDPFVKQAGYTVGVFVSQAGKLLAAHIVANMAETTNEIDWFEECQRLHGRKCNGRLGHANQLLFDSARGKQA